MMTFTGLVSVRLIVWCRSLISYGWQWRPTRPVQGSSRGQIDYRLTGRTFAYRWQDARAAGHCRLMVKVGFQGANLPDADRSHRRLRRGRQRFTGAARESRSRANRIKCVATRATALSAWRRLQTNWRRRKRSVRVSRDTPTTRCFLARSMRISPAGLSRLQRESRYRPLIRHRRGILRWHR